MKSITNTISQLQPVALNECRSYYTSFLAPGIVIAGKWYKFFCIGCLIMGSSLAYAEQEFTIDNNGTVIATVSQREITRIAFKSPIDSVHSIADELEYNVQGNDLYLRTSAEKPVNFFVKTTSGLTYKFILDVRDIPATQIFVNSVNDNIKPNLNKLKTLHSESNENLKHRIAQIINIALSPKRYMGFSFSNTNINLGTINGIILQQVAEVKGKMLTAQRIELINETEEIKEIELSQFIEPGILAVHTNKNFLKPNETGILIRVTE